MGLEVLLGLGPGVGLRSAGQPWAEGRNPVGIGGHRQDARTQSFALGWYTVSRWDTGQMCLTTSETGQRTLGAAA